MVLSSGKNLNKTIVFNGGKISSLLAPTLLEMLVNLIFEI